MHLSQFIGAAYTEKTKKNNDCWVFSSVNGTFILQVNRQKILYILYGQFFSYFFLFFGHRNKQQQPVQHTSDNQLEWLITNYLAEFFFFGSVARPVQ